MGVAPVLIVIGGGLRLGSLSREWSRASATVRKEPRHRQLVQLASALSGSDVTPKLRPTSSGNRPRAGAQRKSDAERFPRRDIS